MERKIIDLGVNVSSTKVANKLLSLLISEGKLDENAEMFGPNEGPFLVENSTVPGSEIVFSVYRSFENGTYRIDYRKDLLANEDFIKLKSLY
ncbi:MAG: hypothetical protein ISS01_01575 [Nanoarchaeota archaeon]|nr:hypothetical protein [Nanoarchaeota archaeon]